GRVRRRVEGMEVQRDDRAVGHLDGGLRSLDCLEIGERRRGTPRKRWWRELAPAGPAKLGDAIRQRAIAIEPGLTTRVSTLIQRPHQRAEGQRVARPLERA